MHDPTGLALSCATLSDGRLERSAGVLSGDQAVVLRLGMSALVEYVIVSPGSYPLASDAGLQTRHARFLSISTAIFHGCIACSKLAGGWNSLDKLGLEL